METFQESEMKKNKNWFFVSFSFAILILTASGCASTPRVVKTVPVYSTPAPTNGLPQSPYKFSQSPAKRVIENDGGEYRAHVRELQRQRLAHERQLARIEQASEEAALAKERGVTLAPEQAAGQLATQMQPAQVQQRALYGVLPNRAPVLLPTQPLIPVVPQYAPYPYYEQRPFYGTLPNGAPVLLPQGGGGGFGGYGNGFGSVPITRGTFRSTVRADWGPVRNGALGKAFNWLTQSESVPGYRHTGGPAVVTRTYTGGAAVVAGGGFTSGLNFRRGR